MHKSFLLFFCFVFSVSLHSQSIDTTIAIIPQPVSVIRGKGRFVLPKSVVISAPSNPQLKQVTDFLSQRISAATGYQVSVSTAATAKATIKLVLNSSVNAELGKEGYQLFVAGTGITIKANEPAGLFYGSQTLIQLFPKEIESAIVVKDVKWQLPVASITDYPRFGWRGLMFDVSRHFFTRQDVEQYINQMVRYKFNLLHLHLTDDEGWRIEIKGLPNLTKVGAWNAKRVGYFGTFTPPADDEPRNFGGFYTQEDLKEIIQYAKERFVNILPEVDVPGHSLAAIASYPDLSCTDGADKYHVRSGEEIMDWSHGAPPIAFVDNTLCPANEKVYTFLDTVISQVARLFPFEYIHLGGDECPKNFWEKNEAIKALMQREGLHDMEEVQSYFEKRVEKIVESKGKKFMGWDEILEGGLAPNAAVMSWRGIKGGEQAAKLGHEVVMSPTTFAYIDYMQGDPITEPRVYASLRLSKAYQFEPVPTGTDARFIKGGQANLWTEQVYNLRHAEYMTWPRGWAIAESVWSPKDAKEWNRFFQKTEQHFKRSDIAEIKYSPAVYDPLFTVTIADTTLSVTLATEAPGLDIYYSFDNTFPDRFYPKYTQPLAVPKESVMLKVVTYKGKMQVGRMISMPIEELKRRVTRKANYP